MARSNVLRNQSIVSTGIFGKTNVFSINSLEDSRVRTNIQSEKKLSSILRWGGVCRSNFLKYSNILENTALGLDDSNEFKLTQKKDIDNMNHNGNFGKGLTLLRHDDVIKSFFCTYDNRTQQKC